MERVQRDPDRKQNVEMRPLVNDSDTRDQPLEILQEKISVLEKAEHAQVHADARDQPNAPFMLIFGFANLTTQPEIHRCGGKKERGEGRIPRAVKNVAGDYEKIFPRRPRTDVPVKRDDDHEENDEGERIKKHGEGFELRCARQRPIYASHMEADV